MTYVEFLPGYRVGNDGSVWSHWAKGNHKEKWAANWRQLKQNLNAGHLRVKIQNKSRYVHLLVLEAFVGPCPSGMEACHWDDDPRNNNLSNLRWATPRDNVLDAFRNGKRSNVGEKNTSSKLTESCVRTIRQLLATGIAQTKIGNQYGVSQATIGKINLRQTWSHVT